MSEKHTLAPSECTEAALQYAVSQAHHWWCSDRGLVRRLLWRIIRVKPLSLIWIAQHEDGDWESARCRGRWLRIWRYDERGLAQVAEVDHLEANEAGPRTPIFRFCVDSERQRMIFQVWDGPRSGFGNILHREASGGWRSGQRGYTS